MDCNYRSLSHAGIKGMKWGVRRFQKKDGSLTPAGKKRYQYQSTGLKAAAARRANEKVDKGFNNWKENVEKRDNAIDLGKKATLAKLAYENDKSNRDLKTAYKQANKEYKKALGANTTYRKGVVRKEVGQDLARKYLSEAKKVQKQLDVDPSNKELQKKYNSLMSKHDIERANARRATEVSSKRSAKKAALKRTMTMTVSAVATTAAIGAGVYAVNKYLDKHDFKINGKSTRISGRDVSIVTDLVKKAKNFLGYIY